MVLAPGQRRDDGPARLGHPFAAGSQAGRERLVHVGLRVGLHVVGLGVRWGTGSIVRRRVRPGYSPLVS